MKSSSSIRATAANILYTNKWNRQAHPQVSGHVGCALLWCFHHNNFIPIDEVETSIHFELFSPTSSSCFLPTARVLAELLMTTHDINLLNEGYIRRDVVWFTDKSRAGATQLKRLSSLGLHKTMNPYHAYKQGKLVDLPFLGSIYLDKED